MEDDFYRDHLPRKENLRFESAAWLANERLHQQIECYFFLVLLLTHYLDY